MALDLAAGSKLDDAGGLIKSRSGGFGEVVLVRLGKSRGAGQIES